MHKSAQTISGSQLQVALHSQLLSSLDCARTATLEVGTHTHTAAAASWMLILCLSLCSFGSDSSADPSLHSSNPVKCTLMPPRSLVLSHSILIKHANCAQTHTVPLPLWEWALSAMGAQLRWECWEISSFSSRIQETPSETWALRCFQDN